VDGIALPPETRQDGYGYRFTGFLRVPADGIYTFYGRSSVLSQLYVGGTMVVETQSRRRERSGDVALKAGLHPIILQMYFYPKADRTLEYSYSGPGIPRQPIPAAALFHAEKAP
jgi:hypothetical protein